jgi:hypothetical protein
MAAKYKMPDTTATGELHNRNNYAAKMLLPADAKPSRKFPEIHFRLLIAQARVKIHGVSLRFSRRPETWPNCWP